MRRVQKHIVAVRKECGETYKNGGSASPHASIGLGFVSIGLYDPRALHRGGELFTAVISEERGGVSGQAGTVGAFRHKLVATEGHVLRFGSFFSAIDKYDPTGHASKIRGIKKNIWGGAQQ